MFLFASSSPPPLCSVFFFFFFNDTATTEIYTLSLHDALPIYPLADVLAAHGFACRLLDVVGHGASSVGMSRKSSSRDRKSTRLNSSHLVISYAVFCLKKKKKNMKLIIKHHTPFVKQTHGRGHS